MTKRLGLVIDQERCIGCEACTVACKIENNSEAGDWIRVETQGGARKDTPGGQYPELRIDFLPRLCMHCGDPPCIEVCSVQAIFKRKDGPVVLDREKCDGCQACIEACPYRAILFSQEKEKAEKCNLCVHRIDQGLDPFCVICCEGQAIHFGDLNDPSHNVSMLVSTKKVFQLKPETNTGPSVYYCYPRERKRL